ncbi:hypothetical protein ACSDR0_50585, partial [Streptosporangium sp. G11]|uniref:hypothetical protein n=1 Tax=Streptosporangium sp. G11 TaxID=3436926 RepID=UPI003EBDA515
MLKWRDLWRERGYFTGHEARLDDVQAVGRLTAGRSRADRFPGPRRSRVLMRYADVECLARWKMKER